MQNFIAQAQLLLAALSALLSFAPASVRAGLGQVLDVIAAALKAGEIAADAAEALALKFQALRAEVEAMGAAGQDATPAQIEAAFARVEAASAAFRASLSETGLSTTSSATA